MLVSIFASFSLPLIVYIITYRKRKCFVYLYAVELTFYDLQNIFLKVPEIVKADATRFSPFWNEIIRNLREEDYVTSL